MVEKQEATQHIENTQKIKPKGIAVAQLKAAGIGEDYWGIGWADYKGPVDALNSTMRYFGDNLETMKEQGVGLMWVGPYGPGKTTLAMITAKYLLKGNWNVYSTSLGEIVEQIQRGWRENDTSGEQFVERCRCADFLFIDDVGKEHRGQSGFVQTVFDNLIRYRTQHRLPTFITTNYSKSELEDSYGGSVISLLEGKIVPITVDGGDYRRTHLKKQNRRILKDERR